MNDFFSALFRRLRLLPVLVVVATLAFVVRLGDTVFQIKNLRGEAQAQEKTEPAAGAAAAKKEEVPKVADTPVTPPVEGLKAPEEAAAGDKPAVPASKADAKKIEWADSDSDLDNDDLRKEMMANLNERRQMIEEKEKELAQREALLKAGNEEINKKVEELTAIRNEIESLLKKQNAQEDADTSRLVKIYEGMKPKDAARIFNQLDMDVLLSVVTKMSERKSSAIISAMDPDKARSLTLFLSEQNKLSGPGKPGQAGFGNALKPPALPESAIR